MSIKVRIIREHKENPHAASDEEAIKDVADALGISAEQVESAMSAAEDDELSESIMSMLTDPMVIAGLVAVAAMGKAALDNAVSSIKRGTESNDQTMKRILGDDWRDKAKQAVEQKKAGRTSAEEKLAQMKADRGMGDTEPNDVSEPATFNFTALEDKEGSDPDGGVAKMIPPKVIERYLNFRASAQRGFGGEKTTAQKLANKMEKEWEGIANHPDVLNAEKLNEAFRRFL
jgi:hypothetical protein